MEKNSPDKKSVRDMGQRERGVLRRLEQTLSDRYSRAVRHARAGDLARIASMISSERSEANRGRVDAKLGPKRWANVMAVAMENMKGDDLARLLALPGLPTPEAHAECLNDALGLACKRVDCSGVLPWIRRFGSAGRSSLLSILSAVEKDGPWGMACLAVATEIAQSNESSRVELVAWHSKYGVGIEQLDAWLSAGWNMGEYACNAMKSAGWFGPNGVAIFWWASHFGERIDENAWMPALNAAAGAIVNKELMQAMQDAGAPWDKHAKEALIIAVNRNNFEATSWLVDRGHRLSEGMGSMRHEVYENALMRSEMATSVEPGMGDRSKPRI